MVALWCGFGFCVSAVTVSLAAQKIMAEIAMGSPKMTMGRGARHLRRTVIKTAKRSMVAVVAARALVAAQWRRHTTQESIAPVVTAMATVTTTMAT